MKGKIIAGIILIAVVVGTWMVVSRARANRDDKATYKTAKVERGDLVQAVSATGILQSLTTVDVKSKAGGRVDDLLVDIGSIVKKGQLIARIDPTDTLTTYSQAQADMEANRARMRQAEDNLLLQDAQTGISIEQAQAGLDAARSRLDQARKQARVQPSLTEASIKQARASHNAALHSQKMLEEATIPQARAQAQAAFDQAKANLDNAEKTLRRQQELAGRGFIAQQQVDTARTQRDVTQAQLNNAEKKLATLDREFQAQADEARSRVEQAKAALDNTVANRVQNELRRNDVREAEAAVRQAEAQLAQARLNTIQKRIRAADIQTARSQIERSKAQLNNAKITLESTTILAPRGGVVLQKYLEQGTIIPPGTSTFAQGTSIVQIGDLSRMFCDVQVDETDIASVEVGQTVDITIDAYPDELFDGKVTRIDPQAKTEQNVTMVHVQVEIDNPDARLKPGMNATCEFIVAKKENVLQVPNEAIKERDDQKTVQVMANGKPEARTVETGITGNDATEIAGGLREGEEVVTQTIEPSRRGQAAQGSPGGPARGMPGGFGGFGGRGGGGGRR
ncbi:MAG: efflux RND transporter periplasmic adaptor subunit [Armatimonadetes bacterium]|nr:efflux RND transporter periplasmic adaptor subunit [Armatimonadota bacterium]